MEWGNIGKKRYRDIWNGYNWREKSIGYINVVHVDTKRCSVFRIQRHVYECRLRDMDWTSIYVGASSKEKDMSVRDRKTRTGRKGQVYRVKCPEGRDKDRDEEGQGRVGREDRETGQIGTERTRQG